MSTNKSSADYDQFEALAEEFAARFRQGERPSLQEYIDRCPELADEIRDLFPALVEVERFKGDQPAQAERCGIGGRPAGAGPGGRLPGAPRGRPWRHGRGIRGRAGLSRPPRGPQGPAPASLVGPQDSRPVPPRGALGSSSSTTPTSCRSSKSVRMARLATMPCNSSRARGWTRLSTSFGD